MLEYPGYFSNTSKPTFVMMVGESGSGKSTWIEAVIPNDWVIISSDDIIDTLNTGRLSDVDAYKKYASRATSLMNIAVELAFRNRQNIVWDQTNLSANSRRKKLARVNRSYRKVAIWFDLPQDALASRRKHRIDAGGKNIPQRNLDFMKNTMSDVTYSEGFTDIIKITS